MGYLTSSSIPIIFVFIQIFLTFKTPYNLRDVRMCIALERFSFNYTINGEKTCHTIYVSSITKT